VRLTRWGDRILTEVAGQHEEAKALIGGGGGRQQVTLVDGGGLQVDLQHGKGAAKLRRGPIGDECDQGWEFTERGERQ
jgi:hypothetical protein